jgi:DNA modification methylase
MTPYYQSETATIYHADCKDVLEELSPVGMLLTDPPYGIGRSKGMRKHLVNSLLEGTVITTPARQYPKDTWDFEPISQELLDTVLCFGRVQVIWGGVFFSDLLPRASHWVVWNKRQSMPSYSKAEIAWTNSRRKSVAMVTILQSGFMAKEKKRYHPTQKPVELMRWCIENYLKSGSTVLDPFMGAGSTILAAAAMGKQAIGIEREERYCEIAAKRLEGRLL